MSFYSWNPTAALETSDLKHFTLIRISHCSNHCAEQFGAKQGQLTRLRFLFPVWWIGYMWKCFVFKKRETQGIEKRHFLIRVAFVFQKTWETNATIKHVCPVHVYVEKEWKSSAVHKNMFCVNEPYGVLHIEQVSRHKCWTTFNLSTMFFQRPVMSETMQKTLAQR